MLSALCSPPPAFLWKLITAYSGRPESLVVGDISTASVHIVPTARDLNWGISFASGTSVKLRKRFYVPTYTDVWPHLQVMRKLASIQRDDTTTRRRESSTNRRLILHARVALSYASPPPDYCCEQELSSPHCLSTKADRINYETSSSHSRAACSPSRASSSAPGKVPSPPS